MCELGQAQAETVNCTAVTTAPFTISAPGIYCLTGDLTTNLASGVCGSAVATSGVGPGCMEDRVGRRGGGGREHRGARQR